MGRLCHLHGINCPYIPKVNFHDKQKDIRAAKHNWLYSLYDFPNAGYKRTDDTKNHIETNVSSF